MKRKFGVLFLSVIAAIIMLVACSTGDTGGGETDGIETNVLPSKFMVDVPASLTGSTSTTTTNVRSTRAGGDSYAYFEVKMKIYEMQMQNSNVAMNFIMIDEVCKDRTPSADIVENATVHVTQELVNKLITLLLQSMEGMMEEMDEMYVGTGTDYETEMRAMFSQMIGTDQPIGSFIYNTAPADSGYDYSFSFLDFAEGMDSGTEGEVIIDDLSGDIPDGFSTRASSSGSKMQILWTADKKNSKIVDSYITIVDDVTTDEYTNIFTYDDTTKTSDLIYKCKSSWEGMEFDDIYKVTLKEDSDSDANGVILKFDSQYSSQETMAEMYYDETTDMWVDGDMVQYTFSGSYKAEGMADDNGGYLESENIWQDPWNNNKTERFKTKEGFDADGNVTYAKYYDYETSSWVAFDEFLGVTEDFGEYDDDVTAWEDIETIDDETFGDERLEVDVTGAVEGEYFQIAKVDLSGLSLTDGLTYENILSGTFDSVEPTNNDFEQVFNSIIGYGFCEADGIVVVEIFDTEFTGTAYLYKESFDEETYEISYSAAGTTTIQ